MPEKPENMIKVYRDPRKMNNFLKTVSVWGRAMMSASAKFKF